ncbi:hypothetical protein RIF23_11985 [Lipingzhangella sp. LS1_29]|uniref:Nitrite/Sulfite reductase ferredoxin-like domain-containing protein n=1 Tax=Lipingzhangella rawalii TaxID=2055835 RepID=A0ABU2H6T8_9ACTN|nr:hypothetical protein [Lipingzhangella rawalii]MDS1271018.1 hypothetical protein [Lipingzhangella rawalii]
MSDLTGAVAARPDACPGALRPHHAADGALVRIRLPGGRISPQGLRALSDSASRWGNGRLDITGRGNIQLRGLDTAVLGRLAEVLRSAGMLPSVTHERARNIVASPLSGLDAAGQVDLSPLVHELDQRLCARPELSELGGRFLFGLDDGRGDILGLRADVSWCAIDPARGALTFCGQDTGLRPTAAQACGVLVTAAVEFLRLRGGDPGVWRLRDLPGGADALAAAVRAAVPTVARLDHRPTPGEGALPSPAAPPTVGTVLRSGASQTSRASAGSDGDPNPRSTVTARVITPPLGRLTATQAHRLADLADLTERAELADTTGAPGDSGDSGATDVEPGDRTGDHHARSLVVTPWRDIVLPGPAVGAEERLREAGLVVDPESPWHGVSACAGISGCAKSLTDVRADATRFVRLRTDPDTRTRVHWVGCSRRCGSPSTPHTAVVATATDTYQIDATDSGVSAGDAPARVAQALDSQ